MIKKKILALLATCLSAYAQGNIFFPNGGTPGDGNATSLQGFPISTATPGQNQVLTFLSGIWTPANVPTGTPTVCAETYMTTGMNGDYGQAINAAVQAQSLTQLSIVEICTQGNHPILTTFVIDRPVILSAYGSTLIPQNGGGGGAWGSAPIPYSVAVVTGGSTSVSVPSGVGLASSGMNIGGIGLRSASHIASAIGTTLTLDLPANLVLNCQATSASNILTHCGDLKGATVGQVLVNSLVLPGGTSIASINYSNQSITLSASATLTMDRLQDFVVSGSWTTALTAQKAAPVGMFQWNVNALRNAEGQNIGGDIWGLTIQDPGYTMTCNMTLNSATLTNCSNASVVVGNMSITGPNIATGTTTSAAASGNSVSMTNPATGTLTAGTVNIGYNLGRSLSGVEGVQVGGFDNLSLRDVHVFYITSSALILGGFVSGANSHQGLNRESYYTNMMLRDSGDYKTGQPTVAVMTGLGVGDEINQIGFSGLQCVFNNGEAVTFGTYVLSHLGSAGLGPRLIWIINNSQFEGGSHYPNNINSNVDMIGVQQAADISFIGDEINGPGYSKSDFRLDNITTLSVNSSRIRMGAASSAVCTVGVTNGSTLVTWQSGCSQFDTSGKWDGVGIRITDHGSCSGVCNEYLAVDGAVTSATTFNLAAPYAGSTDTAATMNYTTGGYGINNAGVTTPYITTAATTGNQASANTLAVLQVPGGMSFFEGYISTFVNDDFVQSGGPGSWHQNVANINNPKIASGTLFNVTGSNIQVGGNAGISYGDIVGGTYNGVFMSWVKRGLGSNTNSNYMGLNGAVNFFSFDPLMMGWGTHTQPESDNWNVDDSGNTIQAGSVTSPLILSANYTATGLITMTSNRTTSGPIVAALCPMLSTGLNCGYSMGVDGATMDSAFWSFVFAGTSNSANRAYTGITGGTGLLSYGLANLGYGTSTSPTSDAWFLDTSGNSTQTGNAIIGGNINLTGLINVSSGLTVASTRTSSGEAILATCGSLTAGNNCGIGILVGSGSFNSWFGNFVYVGAGSTSNRYYSQILGASNFFSFDGSTLGFGASTTPSSSAFHVTGAGALTSATAAIGGGSTVNSVNYFSTGSITPAAVTAQTCSDQSFTMTGVLSGDLLGELVAPSSLGNISTNVEVASSNTIQIHFCNPSVSSVTPPAGVYSVLDLR